MKQNQKRSWKMGLSTLLAGGGLLFSATPGFAEPDVPEIGTEIWQQQYNPDPTENYYRNGVFWSVGFNTDGSVLANGHRSEADSGSGIGMRYNAETGVVLDPMPEWILFEYNFYDYAQDRFRDQYIDSSGNMYFVGMSYRASWNSGASKYTRYNVPNVWKYSSSYSNTLTTAADRPLWKSYYAGSGDATQENGTFEAIAADSVGNIYAVGYYLNLFSTLNPPSTASQRDWIIDKFDSDGVRVTGFPVSYNKDNLHDYAYDVATDSEDNFVVVGAVLVDAATDHYDWAVRKYASNGSLVWETQSDLSAAHDQAFSVAVDGDDNVIVAGYRTKATGDRDWYIVKYAKDDDGNGGATIIWEKSWDNGNSQHGEARGLVLDHNGFIYIVGSQAKSSVTPAYTDRSRPVLQYRHGHTGELLGIQEFILDKTPNDILAEEHDYLRGLALKGDQLVKAGYTQQDGLWSVRGKYTSRVLMLKLVPIPMFADGFE
jgi:hypothetical protein